MVVYDDNSMVEDVQFSSLPASFSSLLLLASLVLPLLGGNSPTVLLKSTDSPLGERKKDRGQVKILNFNLKIGGCNLQKKIFDPKGHVDSVWLKHTIESVSFN